MFIQASTPQSFWVEAIVAVAQIKNMLPHSVFNDSVSPVNVGLKKVLKLCRIKRGHELLGSNQFNYATSN